MTFLSEVAGKGLITGQHTQTRDQKELGYIQEVTGKLPALCGFELLSYSPNINYEDSGEECLVEVEENKNTLEKAWDWVLNQKGLITFAWHWFSPIGGRDKSFYTEFTDYDASQAVIEGTVEHQALISDMDHIAEILKEFRDKRIPLLWRPFHEAEGTWFWWGAKGPDVARKLYRIMYERYTNVHHLDNLIWVWNSPLKEGYPGDEVVDVISRDLYPPKRKHTALKPEYEELIQITPVSKVTALGEIGVTPNISEVAANGIPWAWYMIWSKEYGSTDVWTSEKVLYATYHHEYAITLDKLPRLY